MTRSRWSGLALAVGLTLVMGLHPRTLGASQPLDCSAFDSQIRAQSVYDMDSTQDAALDPDGNGLACEQYVLGAAPA